MKVDMTGTTVWRGEKIYSSSLGSPFGYRTLVVSGEGPVQSSVSQNAAQFEAGSPPQTDMWLFLPACATVTSVHLHEPPLA